MRCVIEASHTQVFILAETLQKHSVRPVRVASEHCAILCYYIYFIAGVPSSKGGRTIRGR